MSGARVFLVLSNWIAPLLAVLFLRKKHWRGLYWIEVLIVFVVTPTVSSLYHLCLHQTHDAHDDPVCVFLDEPGWWQVDNSTANLAVIALLHMLSHHHLVDDRGLVYSVTVLFSLAVTAHLRDSFSASVIDTHVVYYFGPFAAAVLLFEISYPQYSAAYEAQFTTRVCCNIGLATIAAVAAFALDASTTESSYGDIHGVWHILLGIAALLLVWVPINPRAALWAKKQVGGRRWVRVTTDTAEEISSAV